MLRPLYFTLAANIAGCAALVFLAMPALADGLTLACKGGKGVAQTYDLNKSRNTVKADGIDASNVSFSAKFVEFDVRYPNGRIYEHALHLDDMTLRVIDKSLEIMLPLQKCSAVDAPPSPASLEAANP